MSDAEMWTIQGTAILYSQKGPRTLPTPNRASYRDLIHPKGAEEDVIVDNGLGSLTVPLTAWVTPEHDAIMRVYHASLILVTITNESAGEVVANWSGRVYQYKSDRVEFEPDYMLAQLTLVLVS